MPAPLASAPNPVSLNQLLADCGLPGVDESPLVSHITHRSDEVVPGSLFCCLPGRVHDGHDFAAAAKSQGAVALLCERPLGSGLPEVQVADARAAMAPLAAACYGHPSSQIPVIGVTGTDGKTSVVSMVAEIYRAAGRPVRTIGTLSHKLTTPEAPELQRQLFEAAQASEAVVMEVSSHAIAQHRIDALSFELCAFTNLSNEHLDFHFSMEDYYQSKRALFTAGRARQSVICTETEYGQRLYRELMTEFSPAQVQECSIADIAVSASTTAGSTIEIDGMEFKLQLAGEAAVKNAALAFAMARRLGFDSADIKSGLEQLTAVRGRFQVVQHQPFAVIVDYAHTPAAVELTLNNCRQLTPGANIHVVVGCGGERDAAKRQHIGAAVAQLADFAYITSDNPRHEDPAAIVADILKGIPAGSQLRHVVELDRRAAIHQALSQAGSGDLVLLAGKGHEATQIIGDTALPFDDYEVAAQMLATAAPAPSASGLPT